MLSDDGRWRAPPGGSGDASSDLDARKNRGCRRSLHPHVLVAVEDDDQSPGPGIATISEHVVVVRRGLETESQPVAAAGLVVPGPEITAADAAGVRETVEVEGGLTALRPPTEIAETVVAKGGATGLRGLGDGGRHDGRRENRTNHVFFLRSRMIESCPDQTRSGHVG